MYFYFLDKIDISEEEFSELISLYKEGYDFDEALNDVADYRTIEEYCKIRHIKEQIKKEFERRIAESK